MLHNYTRSHLQNTDAYKRIARILHGCEWHVIMVESVNAVDVITALNRCDL